MMNELQIVVQLILGQEKLRLAPSTFASRRGYFNRLLDRAAAMGIDKPCQELFDEFARDDRGSKERRLQHERCIKVIDAYVKSMAIRLDGRFYNEPSLPTPKESEDYFAKAVWPVEEADAGMLIVKARKEMAYLGLSDSTTGQYLHAWRDLWRHLLLNQAGKYTKEAVRNYIEVLDTKRDSKAIPEWRYKIARKSSLVLMEVADTGRFRWAIRRRTTPCCSPDIEPLRKAYLTSLKEKNFTNSTVSLYDYIFRNALKFCGIESIADLCRMDVGYVTTMVAGFSKVSNSNSMSTIAPILRSVLTYLYKNGAVSEDFSCAVMSGRNKRTDPAGYLTHESVEQLVTQLENERLRDKAIMLTMLRLGLRGCDVCALRLKDVDWERDCIRIVQTKTGVQLTLPLLADVGNAIYDYITYERPKPPAGCDNVFLRSHAPFTALTAVYHITSSIIARAGICPVGKRQTKGSHLLRYTLVHEMLTEGLSRQVITDTLGHTSKESDKPYLSMDESMLRLCAIDPPPLDISARIGGYLR